MGDKNKTTVNIEGSSGTEKIKFEFEEIDPKKKKKNYLKFREIVIRLNF